MAKLNTYLYGLNGYALRLAEAVSVAAEVRQNREEQPSPVALPKSVGAAIEQATQERRQQPDGPAPPSDELSFEALFRRAAQPVVAAEAPA